MNILFLFDAEAFGGHEITALAAMEGLADDPSYSVTALHTNRNQHLINALKELSRRYTRVRTVFVTVNNCFSESVDALRHGGRTRTITHAIRSLNPDLAVNVQGFITIGLCATAACRLLNVPVVSYVPMVHKLWHIRPSVMSFVQDVANRYWYSCPSAYITTSERMKIKLTHDHCVDEKMVGVAEYGPNISTLPAIDKNTARAELGWSNGYHVGIVGRIEFVQKRQDFLIRAIARYQKELRGLQFVIVGDGPNLDDAVRLVHKHNLGEMIRFMEWQSDMWRVYPALDALLLPSRYEGVPLVMMEAMFYRVPVLASNVDGMRDFLPVECLFREGCDSDMISKMKKLSTTVTSETLDQLADLVRDRLNTKIFRDSFVREILRIHELLTIKTDSTQVV